MGKIGETKKNTPIDVLCENQCAEFATYLRYVRKLDFFETPDYAYLTQLFQKLYERKGYENDQKFDWSDQQLPSPSASVASFTENLQTPRDRIPSLPPSRTDHLGVGDHRPGSRRAPPDNQNPRPSSQNRENRASHETNRVPPSRREQPQVQNSQTIPGTNANSNANFIEYSG